MNYSGSIIKLLIWLCVANAPCTSVAVADVGVKASDLSASVAKVVAVNAASVSAAGGNTGEAANTGAVVRTDTDVPRAGTGPAMKKPATGRVIMEEGQAATDAAGDLQNWAREFYLNRPLCGTSEVSDVVIRRDSIVVRLDIEPKWESALSGLGQADAARWFAIHCPLPVAAVEPKVGQRDILVISTSANNPHTDFSCREFERSIRADAAVQQSGIRARVTALLNRLGVQRSP